MEVKNTMMMAKKEMTKKKVAQSRAKAGLSSKVVRKTNRTHQLLKFPKVIYHKCQFKMEQTHKLNCQTSSSMQSSHKWAWMVQSQFNKTYHCTRGNQDKPKFYQMTTSHRILCSQIIWINPFQQWAGFQTRLNQWAKQIFHIRCHQTHIHLKSPKENGRDATTTLPTKTDKKC